MDIGLSPDIVLAGLRRTWRSGALYGGVAIVMIGALVARSSRVAGGLAWATVALAVWLYLSSFVGRRLALNHPLSVSSLLTGFGPGTTATILRGWLLACLAGFLFLPRPPGPMGWIPAVIYTFANVCDFLDGYLARVSGHATLMGEALDIEFDALGLLISVSVAVHYSALPAWFLLVGLARYAFLFGLWLRRRADKPIYPLPPSDSRRPIAGLQMGALGIILVPVLQPAVTTLGGLLLAVPLLAGFTRDWLVVSGSVDVSSVEYQRTRQLVKRIALHWLPVFLRAVVMATALRLAYDTSMVSAQSDLGFGLSALAAAGESSVVVKFLWLAAGAAVGLGAAPRISAALFLVLLLFSAASGENSLTLLISLAAAVGVVMAGGGAISAWQPEVRWFGRRAGDKDITG
jgi:CDP-diacylglycerol--glycerol-3-phosphate 3-phosphatidyltransferase